MTNVALFIFGIDELRGGGGAERFFADFFEIYNKKSNAHRLFYIIDKSSVLNLNKVGKLKSKKNILDFRPVSNRYKNSLEFLQLIILIIFNRIKLIHIPLYSFSYIPLIKKLNRLPAFLKPKIVVNIVNCYVPFALSDEKHASHKSLKHIYSALFNEVEIDGYFCWNESFIQYLNSNNVYAGKKMPVSYAITSRFSDTKKFQPASKQNVIIFASRLDEQKHPEWFIEAISLLNNKIPDEVKKWKFIVSGDGPLRQSLMTEAEHKKIGKLIDFVVEGDLSKMFGSSKAYVSCQDYDNFPSLAMAEAMASGNAIIARDVGQTNLFVKNKVNGVVAEKDTPQGLADAIEFYLKNTDLHEKFSKESIRLMKEVHTPDNFVRQIDTYWSKVLAQR